MKYFLIMMISLFISACSVSSSTKPTASKSDDSTTSSSSGSTSSGSTSSGSTSSGSTSSGSTSSGSTSSGSTSSGSTSSGSTSSGSTSSGSTSSSGGGADAVAFSARSQITNTTYISSANISAYNISGTCTANSTTTIQISVDSSPTDTATCSAGAFSKNLDLSATAEGAHQISVSLGSANASLSATTDTLPPLAMSGISIGSVPSNLSSTPTLNWTVDSTDATSGVLKYQLAVLRSSDNSVISNYADFTKGQSVSVSLSSNTNYYFRIKTIDNAGNETTTNTSEWTSYTSGANTNCPTNYVYVNPNASLSTNGFCVAKFEMKNNGSGGAVSQAAELPYLVSRTDAISKCSSIGSGYRLISNSEWNAVGIEIFNNTTQNYDSTDSYVTGAIGWYAAVLDITNESDEYNQTNESAGSAKRRTFYLTSGQKIWDFGGNAWEWVSTNIDVSTWTVVGTSNSTYGDYWTASGTPERAALFPVPGTVPTNNIGHFAPSNVVSSFQGMLRGAGLYSYGTVGIFSSSFYLSDSTGNLDVTDPLYSGFRCVTDPIP